MRYALIASLYSEGVAPVEFIYAESKDDTFRLAIGAT